MKTIRYTIRNSSLFDSRGYDCEAMRSHLGGMLRNVRTRRFARNQPAQLTFNLAQGISPRAVAEELEKFLGRKPFVDSIT